MFCADTPPVPFPRLQPLVLHIPKHDAALNMSRENDFVNRFLNPSEYSISPSPDFCWITRNVLNYRATVIFQFHRAVLCRLRSDILRSADKTGYIPAYVTWCVHLLRYVTDSRRNSASRLIWLVLMLSSIGLALYQIQDRMVHYSQHLTSTHIELVEAKQLRFPQVTICNENIVMKSSAIKYGMRSWVPCFLADLHKKPSCR